jgi:peptidoglycan/LPS O-acetylase OafA/YrhL
VSFFFVLSGYILAVVYLRPGRAIDKRKFFIARFARIYPLFFATLLLDTPLIVLRKIASDGTRHGLAEAATMFAGSVVMLQAWFFRFLGIDVPNWSLSVETFFYLLFPFLGVLLWKLHGLRLWLAALVIYLAGQAIVWQAFQHLPEVKIRFVPILHLSTFALGILLARWQTSRNQNAARLWLTYLVLGVTAAAVIAVVNLSAGMPEAWLQDGVLAPIFLCVLWAAATSRTWITQLLSHPWLVVLGESSFALYLIHVPVWHLFTLLKIEANPLAYAGYIALCLTLSILSFYFLEKPARQAILRKLATQPKETLEVASDAQ